MSRTRIITIIVLFIVSLTSRIWLTLRYMELGSDKCYQLLAAKNMKEGNGYTLSVQDADNLTKTIYSSLSGWPPGYSIMINVVENFTNDYLHAAVVLDILSVVVLYAALLLFVTWYGHRLKNWMVILGLTFFGISSAPFTTLFSTDFLTVSFFVLASVLFIRWLDTAMKNLLLVLLFIITACMLPFLRYGYYAMVFVFPSFLLCLALVKKNRKYALQALVIGGVFMFFVIVYTYYQVNLSGQSSPMSGGRHINEPGKLYFSNLAYFNAFLYNSLINDFFILNRLSGKMLLLYNIVKYVVTLGMLCLVVFTCIRNIREKKIDNFNLLALFIILANITYLVLVSVKNKLDASEDGTWVWTYVKEFRYYAPAYFITFLFVLYNYAHFSRYYRGFVNIIILPLVISGIGYSAFSILKRNTVGTYKRNHQDFIAKIEELKTHNTKDKLVVINHWERPVDNTSYGSLIQLYNYKVYHDFGYGVLIRSTFVDSAAIIDNHFDKFWSNIYQFKRFDTIYYIGDKTDLEKVQMDSIYHISPTAVNSLFSVSIK